ncbi:hypothetical protein ACFO1B_08795 [Dactylosporangium siamense]|uniref:Uncharacterized protein n=1 Tax=Dactylosporangium siamense TaxID=685454 RepID=A0A919PPY4_9ACTN|nr:hypothetical protein [Dactylosporangium siamense]GIG47914.1 hypothetical protein Dsi01nite_059550 [Dactylosporangium siamense]
MSDLRDPLVDAFAALRGDVTPHVTTPGPADLYRRLDTRHRRVKIATTAAVALAVAGTFAVLRAGPGGDDTSGVGTNTGSTETSVEKLSESTLDLPAWRGEAASACVSGPTRFSGGAHRGPNGTVIIQQVADVDVDHDGAKEAVIHLNCTIQDAVTFQVVAVRRDATGALRTVGQVAAQDDDLRAVCSVQPVVKGAVKLLVSDDTRPDACTRPPSNQTAMQWRTYTWDGRTFRQTGGPTTFPQLPTGVDLAVQGWQRSAFTDLGGGMRRGNLTVTVRNNSAIEAPGWWLYLPIPRNATVTSRYGCVSLSPGATAAALCIGLPLKAGAEFSLTVTMDIPSNVDWPHWVVQVWTPDDYTDPDVGNNDAEYDVGP